jgi:putative addiction module component (TIGR02574 family)
MQSGIRELSFREAFAGASPRYGKYICPIWTSAFSKMYVYQEKRISSPKGNISRSTEMAAAARHVLKEALGLPARERAGLVDKLLSSLDKPDKTMDEIWHKEVDHRLSAYKQGKIKTLSVEEACAKYRKR